jgi:hypothetical protein
LPGWWVDNRAVRALLAMFVLGVVVVLSVPAGGESEGRLARCRWRVVLDERGPELTGVSVLSDGDAWAVGDNGVRATFLHWDAGRWHRIVSPVFALDVDAVSAADIWAVGSSSPGPTAVSLAEHWNGARWTVVTVGGRSGEYLRGVAALSPSDVWAVGARERGPLIEHWDGRRWARRAGGPLDGLLHGIDALSPRAVWAVGTQGLQTTGRPSENPLVERWTGRNWQTLSTPSLDRVDENLLAVDAVSASDAWAVGSVDLPGRLALVLHWNGGTWTRQPTAGLLTADTTLAAVAAVGTSNVWVAGSRGLGQAQRPLLAHWDGRRWRQLQSPLPRGGLLDLAALSPSDIWAVGGSLDPNGSSRSLLERYTCR